MKHSNPLEMQHIESTHSLTKQAVSQMLGQTMSQTVNGSPVPHKTHLRRRERRDC